MLQKAVTAEVLGVEAGIPQFRWNIVIAGE
jgi:hypothetical protein